MFDAPLTDGGHLHAVLLYSDGGLNAGLIRKSEVVTLDLPDIRFRGPATVVAIHRSSAQGDVEAEVVRVVQFRDDDDLGKVLYGEWKPPRDFLERWAGRRRTISSFNSRCDSCEYFPQFITANMRYLTIRRIQDDIGGILVLLYSQ